MVIYCCWGGHFKKRTMRIEIYLAMSFFLLVLFIYFSFFLSFLFLFSSFPSFVFFVSFWGDRSIAPPPQIRHWIYPAISFFLLVLFIYFSFFLSFLFLLSSFSSFVFFVSLWGEGGNRPIAHPSDPPLDLLRKFILSTCFVYLLFLFFSLFFFSFPLFPLFNFFCQPLEGAIAPIAPPPLRSATEYSLTTSQKLLLYMWASHTNHKIRLGKFFQVVLLHQRPQPSQPWTLF